MHMTGVDRSVTLGILLPLILALALLPPPLPLSAGEEKAPANVADSQSYGLSRAVFGSAGRKSTGASYALNGTLGQSHPVGEISGTASDLYAGFWTRTAVVTTGSGETPLAFRLSQNYPNPFNPVTTIDYTISEKSIVDLTIYDVAGRRVRTLLGERQLPGGYSIVWDGRNDSGMPVATGVYFYRLSAGRNRSVKKMVILR